jgi:uncharacterized RmlC-like cupin family protein
MEQVNPIVIKAGEGEAAPPTPGMERRTLFERPDAWAGWIRTDRGVAGGWHHHGGYDSYIYILGGSLTIEFGPGGAERVEAEAGDFIFNPARLIHRETTSQEGDVEAFVVRVGDGPQVINVDAPEPA